MRRSTNPAGLKRIRVPMSRITLAFSLVCVHSCSSGPEAERAQVRPNVLIVISDDLSSAATSTWGLGGQGLVETPGIAALAERGVVLERALCASPFCTPSRQSFLTGRWPHSNRVTQLKSTLPKDSTTLATVFGAAGYRTAAIGKMHWMRTRVGDVSFGFDHIAGKIEWEAQLSLAEKTILDEYNRGWSKASRKGWSMSNPEGKPLDLDEERQQAPYLLGEAVQFMDDASQDPFLVFLSLGEPHAPFHYPPRLIKSVDPLALELPDVNLSEQARQVPGLGQMIGSRRALKGPLTEEVLRGSTAAYLRSVLWMDEQLVALDQYLESSGHWEDTIVVFWSDNGYFLGERGHFGKNYPYREAVEVPLSIAGPTLPAKRSAKLAHAIDVFPTLCELCGIDGPDDLQGVSLVPLLRSGQNVRGDAYTEFVGQMATIETDRWKLHVGAHAAAGWDQLYDIQTDPGETLNLFADPDRVQVRDDLAQRMLTLLADTPPDGLDRAMWIASNPAPNGGPFPAIRRALQVVETSKPMVAPRPQNR